MNQISALFALAYANSAKGMMNLFLVENHSAQEYRLKGGSQQISQKLVEKIGHDKLMLSHQAVKIEQKKDGIVHVHFTNSKVIAAKKVLVTLPPNMIGKTLTFSPGSVCDGTTFFISSDFLRPSFKKNTFPTK